jgi:cytochrome c oxidase assembly protein subunit 15
MLLHLFAVVVAISTALLIFAGGLVTSTGSGLSVPDWPNTYGWFMFTFPLEKMVGGIFYEHSHRLIASTVGFLILVLAVWLWRAEPRRWVRRLGLVALAAVIVQGVLGGITVLWFLPKPISISHAGLAQIVFCLATTIALVTSRGWQRGYRGARIRDSGSGIRDPGSGVRDPGSGVRDPGSGVRDPGSGVREAGSGRRDPGAGIREDRVLQRMAILTTALIYLQIIVGATMRHNDAGLAIPDFPWAFGQLLPPIWDARIGIHFAHRVGAVVVSAVLLATAGHVFFHHGRRRELVRPSLLLLLLLAAQITLGALTILSGKHHIINSLHVVTGGVVLVTSLVLTLRAHRGRFEAPQPASWSAAA